MVATTLDPMLREAAGHYNNGRPDLAEALCRDILNLRSDYLPALHLAAVIAFAGGRMPEGAGLLSRLFALNPNYGPALVTMGDALSVKGEWEAAAATFQHAIRLSPRDASIHVKLAGALTELARFAEAESAYRQSIELDPDRLHARFGLGTVLAKQERFPEAETVYRQVVAQDPSHRGAWLNLGNVLIDLDRHDEAIAAYQQVLNDQDDGENSFAPLALANIGCCLCSLDRIDEAILACRQAIAISPDHASAYINLGMAFVAQDRLEDAMAAYRRAIEIEPTFGKAFSNLAVVLRSAGQLDEAFAASQRAVELQPMSPEVRFNHAHALLLNGQCESGFDDLRWGKKCKLWAHGYPSFSEPEWQGEPFQGRTLLLFADAGLGDVLQCMRYLPMVLERGGSVVVQVQPALMGLLKDSPGVTIISRGVPLPPFDLQLPLMWLPHVFKTTLDSIPAPIPYLHADPDKVADWRGFFGEGSALKVGIVWAGSPMHKGDHYRSLSAEAVLPRLVMPGVQLYSLQKEPRLADMPVLARLGRAIIDLAPRLDDFADTAAAVATLDLVISVDTSVAHLAGAMGRPTWMLLPYALDWRWLRDREDTPWYPTMRLFRQPAPQQWENVITRVAAELGRIANDECGPFGHALTSMPKALAAM